MTKNSKKPSFFTQHLRGIDESYFTHMIHALYFARKSFIASIAITLHAIFPFLFETTGSSIIVKLYKRMSTRVQILKSCSGNKNIAIIGFGAGGILSFFNLVKNYQPKKDEKITIRAFEKLPYLSKGVAYSTKNSNHLLNVVACKMGVESDREDFFNWLCKNGYNYQKNDFVPRNIFGIYLEDLFTKSLKLAKEKGINFEMVNKEIEEIEGKDNHYIIGLHTYNHCIIATGPKLKNSSNNFWNIDLTQYLEEKEIHILGLGLTAFDAIISLQNLNYQGKIFLYSRTGLMPQIHNLEEEEIVNPLDIEDAKLPMSLIFKKFTKACKNAKNWQNVFNAFRNSTQNFWESLNKEQKQRFMRHCFRIWNTHRHRCPPSQFKIIKNLIDQNRVILNKGRPKSSNFIDCTGFDFDFNSGLIGNLIKNNIVETDELGLGIKSNKDNFYILGSLNFGSKLEITSIPDIASQAREISKQILQ